MKHNVNHIISIGSGRPPVAKCTCGWKTEPSSDLLKLGSAAFKHKGETGHELRRPEDKEPLEVLKTIE